MIIICISIITGVFKTKLLMVDWPKVNARYIGTIWQHFFPPLRLPKTPKLRDYVPDWSCYGGVASHSRTRQHQSKARPHLPRRPRPPRNPRPLAPAARPPAGGRRSECRYRKSIKIGISLSVRPAIAVTKPYCQKMIRPRLLWKGRPQRSFIPLFKIQGK